MSEKEQKEIDFDQWTKEEYGNALSYCSRNDLNVSNLNQPESAILPPLVAIWLFDSKTNKEKYWVISGDLPSDHIPGNVAKNAREALRHIVLRWQLKADKIMNKLADNSPKLVDHDKQAEFAKILSERAGNLFDMAENDDLWKKA